MSNVIMEKQLGEFNFFSRKKKALNSINKKIGNIVSSLFFGFILFNGYSVYNVMSKTDVRQKEVYVLFQEYNEIQKDLDMHKIDLKKLQSFQDKNLIVGDLIFGSIVLNVNLDSKVSVKDKEKVNSLYENTWDNGLRNEKSLANNCTIDVACYLVKEYEYRNKKSLKLKLVEQHYEFDHLKEYEEYVKNVQNGKYEDPKWKKYFLGD